MERDYLGWHGMDPVGLLAEPFLYGRCNHFIQRLISHFGIGRRQLVLFAPADLSKSMSLRRRIAYIKTNVL